MHAPFDQHLRLRRDRYWFPFTARVFVQKKGGCLFRKGDIHSLTARSVRLNTMLSHRVWLSISVGLERAARRSFEMQEIIHSCGNLLIVLCALWIVLNGELEALGMVCLAIFHLTLSKIDSFLKTTVSQLDRIKTPLS